MEPARRELTVKAGGLPDLLTSVPAVPFFVRQSVWMARTVGFFSSSPAQTFRLQLNKNN